ncbi:MAG: hypothetical protein ABSB31_04820 [Dehalococcoidia bacterium]|jgi:hypothetical protein
MNKSKSALIRAIIGYDIEDIKSTRPDPPEYVNFGATAFATALEEKERGLWIPNHYPLIIGFNFKAFELRLE